MRKLWISGSSCGGLHDIQARYEELGIRTRGRGHGSNGGHEFYSDMIIKIGVRCFFCNQEGHFRMDFPLFWEAVKNQNHPKPKLALAAVQNSRNRQAENDLNKKEAAGGELSTKTVKAVTLNKVDTGAEKRNSLEINYERAAAEVINKVKQDLATKKNEKRLKQEIEKQRLNETLCMTRPEPETGETSMSRST